jgi:exodeoxyribonuclease VII small subunit
VLNEKTFEQAVVRLEEIVRILERGEAPLDESLALFEEGASLVKTASAKLQNAEQKIIALSQSPDGTPLETLFAIEDA